MKNIYIMVFCLSACAAQAPLPFANKLPRKDPAEAFGKKIMISADGPASTRAGAEIVAKGGNAVDAAVAVSFAISVERPQSTGLGGGGFFLLYLAKEKKTIAYDFREKAPRAASRDMYLDAKGNPVPNLSTNGALAVGVPGLVAGLVEIQKKYGKLSLAEVMAPAIRLAENGFPIYDGLAEALADRAAVLGTYPSSKKIFLHADNSPLRAGEKLMQKDLARTLRTIAKLGKNGFYRGEIAARIVAQTRHAGGLLTQKDFDAYRVMEREPVRGTFMGFDVVSMPPPSSGGANVIEILNIVEKDPLLKLGASSPQSVHLLASAMQRAFADRAEFLGDTDFVKVPLRGLTDKNYAAKVRATIPAYYATPSMQVSAGNPVAFEPEHTTHLTVMDSEGNTVSSTQTINGWMGSGFVVEGTGIVLNNEMDDFSVKSGVANLYGAIGNDKNAVAPGKRPLSSMSPTIIFSEGKPMLALGSPSGTRIITCVAQAIVNRLAFRMPLYESVAVIRYHHQWTPDEIRVDSPGFPVAVQKDLEKRGYKIREQNLGCRVAAVEREPNGDLHGVADPRGEGISLGD